MKNSLINLLTKPLRFAWTQLKIAPLPTLALALSVWITVTAYSSRVDASIPPWWLGVLLVIIFLLAGVLVRSRHNFREHLRTVQVAVATDRLLQRAVFPAIRIISSQQSAVLNGAQMTPSQAAEFVKNAVFFDDDVHPLLKDVVRRYWVRGTAEQFCADLDPVAQALSSALFSFTHNCWEGTGQRQDGFAGDYYLLPRTLQQFKQQQSESARAIAELQTESAHA